MPVVQSLITIVLFFVVLGLLVLIHELGHFLTARAANVRVLEFGIGFPPRAKVLRSKGETVYTLNWLPIGGFVKLEGEDGVLVHLVLPLGERDLGAAVDEPRPAVGLVHVRLLEAERPAVERPGCVEVLDAEPDRRHRARPGSSRNCLTVRRNSDAVAPSTVRWSQVSVSSRTGRETTSPSRTTARSSIAPTARMAA